MMARCFGAGTLPRRMYDDSDGSIDDEYDSVMNF